MPNQVTVNGFTYSLPTAEAASDLLLIVLESIDSAIKDQASRVVSMHTESAGEPVHVVIVITPASTVHASFDRTDGEVSEAWEDNLDMIRERARARS